MGFDQYGATMRTCAKRREAARQHPAWPLENDNFHWRSAIEWNDRTAWAAAGNGVLVIDADGNGKIDQKNEVVFTAWDPTATDDMQALRNVFDSNHNGKLDAGDARWNDFKIMVTNNDGTTTLKTLAELGIQSIDLVPDHKTTVLADGSTITGTASFTRIDGTKGVAADVSLSFDAQGFAVLQTETLNADGSVTVDSKARNADGSLANETISITSADGKSKTLRFDHDGDGVIDEVQTTTLVINANGSKTETLINATGAGRIVDKILVANDNHRAQRWFCRSSAA